MKKMNTLDLIALIILIVGGLNWGLVGAFDFDLVGAILGKGLLANLVYILVGLSAVYSLSLLAGNKKEEATPTPDQQ